MVFNTFFNIISVMSRWSVHLSMLSWHSFYNNSSRYSFQNHQLLFCLTFVKTLDCIERGMKSVTITVIWPWKDIGQTGNRTRDLLFLSPPLFELRGLTGKFRERKDRRKWQSQFFLSSLCVLQILPCGQYKIIWSFTEYYQTCGHQSDCQWKTFR